MVKFDGIRWIVIQLNYLEQALHEGAAHGNEYLQKLLDFCNFLKNPQKTEPFTPLYEDYMKYWTPDKIKAYELEMNERERIDRASSKAYTEDLIRDLSATVEANKAALADKDATIADLMRRMSQLETLLAAKT